MSPAPVLRRWKPAELACKAVVLIVACLVGCIVLQAVYVPADDLTDPAPATTFAHLDATTVLSRGIAELGIYPAVDPLDSTSRMLDPRILGERVSRIDCILAQNLSLAQPWLSSQYSSRRWLCQ
jgi:hypothetical protein